MASAHHCVAGSAAPVQHDVAIPPRANRAPALDVSARYPRPYSVRPGRRVRAGGRPASRRDRHAACDPQPPARGRHEWSSAGSAVPHRQERVAPTMVPRAFEHGRAEPLRSSGSDLARVPYCPVRLTYSSWFGMILSVQNVTDITEIRRGGARKVLICPGLPSSTSHLVTLAVVDRIPHGDPASTRAPARAIARASLPRVPNPSCRVPRHRCTTPSHQATW